MINAGNILVIQEILIRNIINIYNFGNLMPKRFIRFNIPQDESKKCLFLRDAKADFIVMLQKKTFQLHKQLLGPSEFFKEAIAKDKKSIVIHNHLNIDCFQKILGCFYGIEASFQRHNILTYLLDILSLLKVKQLNDQLTTDMRNNFQQYGLFNLFYLSRMFGLRDIQQKCLKELINEEFQQINYNKYDLFQLSPELFIFIIKDHEKQKALRQISGLEASQIKAVCQQYSKTNNNAAINLQQIFNYGKQFHKQAIKNDQQQQQQVPVIRKRNATWTSMPQKQGIGKKVKTEQCSALSQQRIISLQQKNNEVMKIRLINSNMQQNNNRLAAQIRSVRSTIDEQQYKQCPDAIDDLNKRLKQFQQKSKNAHKKMEDLKNKMLQLNLDQDKNQNGQRNYVNDGSPAQKQNRRNEKSSTILAQMAVLKKNQDLDSDSDDQY